MSRPWRIAPLGYVVLEGVLGAVAFSADHARPLAEWSAFLLLLPSVFFTLPVIYVVGAVAWNIRDSMMGEPMWPVTVIFSGLFLAAAVINVVLVWLLVSAFLRRKWHAARQTPHG